MSLFLVVRYSDIMLKDQWTDKQKAKVMQIIDAAVHCFAEKGFHATSTAEICKAAGMSPGNVFHYFSSKMEIIQAIAVEDGLIFQALFDQHIDESQVVESIVSIMRAILDYLASDLTNVRVSIEIGTEASRNPEVMKIFLENEEINKAKLSRLISIGIEKGEIDPELNPEATASWLLALGDGTIGRRIMEPNLNWDEHNFLLERMIRKALAP